MKPSAEVIAQQARQVETIYLASKPALAILWQNRLLPLGDFMRFASERDAPRASSIGYSPQKLVRRWIRSDHRETDAYHPFRFLSLAMLTQQRSSSVTITFDSPKGKDLAAEQIDRILSFDGFDEDALLFDSAASLAIAMEPCFWPAIVGSLSRPSHLRYEAFEERLAAHQESLRPTIENLDADAWRKIHEVLRFMAYRIDRNSDLYLLLRLSSWDQRKRITGAAGAALWVRHIAEVIRRGFEFYRGERWPEEDDATGMWFPGARARTYGSDRPLDNRLAAQPYIVREFGLVRGSVVRWYVEGETEFAAICTLLPDRESFGIELKDLRGEIAGGKGSAAKELRSSLFEDRALRRFSMISFDCDVGENKRVVSRLCQEDLIVGVVNGHKPDFEFANFTLEELQQIAAATADQLQAGLGDLVRATDWSGVDCGAELEEQVKQVTYRKLKGATWGRALGEWALRLPYFPGGRTLRPIIDQVSAARGFRLMDYDAHREDLRIDPESFQLVQRQVQG